MSIENGTPSTEKAKIFLDSHTKSICDKAELLLATVLPTRISTLDELCKSENFAWDSIGKVKECSISGEKIEVNTFLDQRFTEIKPFIHQFIEDSTLLRNWVTLLIPKTEDGDSLGVSIQYNIVNECDSFITAVSNMYYKASDFHLQRARMISKFIKYPDMAKACVKISIAEYDEAMFVTIRSYPQKLYYYSVQLYDTILKNIEKVRKPRNDSHELYFTW